MHKEATHDQLRWVSRLLGVAVLGFSIVGAWRWWIAPRRAAAAAADTPELARAREAALEHAASLGRSITLDHTDAELAWRAPGECVEVYRVQIDEQFRDPSVALFVGREEEHSSWALALGPRLGAREPADPELVAVDGLLIRVDHPDEPERRRQLWWSARSVGPAAPDFACRQRSWDPLEDTLALGWPTLPGRSARVGERWQGAAVEGRCHETTCVDDQGQFPHDRPCRARAWREQLAGAGELAALILSDWDDGHDLARPEIGILTSRELLIADGRPLYARVTIEQRWAGVQRQLALTRIDDCPDQIGASHDNKMREASTADQSVVTQIRARLRLSSAGQAQMPQQPQH